DAILPAHRTTSVDYAYAWAGVYHRRLVERGLLHFTDGLRTAEDRPWIWRLHREAESFALSGLLGVFYRRGLPSSLTQIGDARQLDFVRAFDQVVEETVRDPEAAALRRMPQDVLDEALNSMDAARATRLRRLRRRPSALEG